MSTSTTGPTRGTLTIYSLDSNQVSTTPPNWEYTIRAKTVAGGGESVQPFPVASVLRNDDSLIEYGNMTEKPAGLPDYNWELKGDCGEDPKKGKVVAIFQKSEAKQETFPFGP